jgi:hypothetical protein
MAASDMSAELLAAVADVKRGMGVDTATVEGVAVRLPDGLRKEFWRHTVGHYLAEQETENTKPEEN